MSRLAAVALGLALAALAGCDRPPRSLPEFSRGDAVLLAPDDAPALVVGVDCYLRGEPCSYLLRLPGLKEHWVHGELGIRRRG